MLVPIATKLKWRLPRPSVIRPLPALPFSSPPSILISLLTSPAHSASAEWKLQWCCCRASASVVPLPGRILNIALTCSLPHFLCEDVHKALFTTASPVPKNMLSMSKAFKRVKRMNDNYWSHRVDVRIQCNDACKALNLAWCPARSRNVSYYLYVTNPLRMRKFFTIATDITPFRRRTP